MHSTALLVSPEIAPPALAADLLRLHATLTQSDLWNALRLLVRNALSTSSLTLEIDRSAEGGTVRSYRHGQPATARDIGLPHPALAWLPQHVGTPVFRFSDVMPLRELRQHPFHERVMKREGWDKQLTLVVWHGKSPRARLNLNRGPNEPDFSYRDQRMAEALQPHVAAAVQRVLAHEDAVYLGEQVSRMLDDAPVGLLLLDWDAKPLWYNREGAHACVVWAHGEKRAAG